MPLHRPEKPWGQALDEDRRAIIAADAAGYAEVWMGEHFSTKVEQVPAPLMFLATLIGETSLRLGTGVVNLGHRHPVVVAAEAALFDQLSGGRLLLGVGPGGLVSDAELFGRPEMAERVEAALESIEMIKELWSTDAPFELNGRYWQGSLTEQHWPKLGVGLMPKPVQQPHPPMAMAMVSPAGRTPVIVAEHDLIPISANFVPLSAVKGQWETYSNRRTELGRPVDRSIWRVCRNILVTSSDGEADEIVADPDGVFAYYFRYLAAVRDMTESRDDQATPEELNERLQVQRSLDKCVVAGSAATVTEKLIEVVDELGPFGTLVAVGHDWDGTDRWERSIKALAADVAPSVAAHMASLGTAR